MNKEALRTALANFIVELDRQARNTHDAEDRPLYETFLSRAAVVIAKVEQGKNIGDDVSDIERLFGHTWFKDGNAYKKIYSERDSFKAMVAQSIYGMTVNEHLYELGLFDEFDNAIASGDEPRLRAVLSKCFLSNENIEVIIARQLKEKG
jgi:hypothetical protein